MSISLQERQSILKECYVEATKKKGLIDFTKEIRTENNDLSGKYSLKQARLAKLFSSAVWIDASKKGGHRKVSNVVTGVVIEYADHQKDIDPGAAQTIFERVQTHLNILCNDIFGYKKYNWKFPPSYPASASRWQRIG